MKKLKLSLLTGLLLVLAACAPTVSSPPPAPSAGPTFAAVASAAEEPARATAVEIRYLMQLGHHQEGSYTSNVLHELDDLPRGVAFRMESFPGESFELRVTDDAVPGVYFLVTPAGVSRHETSI